jgi:hypothetical protein
MGKAPSTIRYFIIGVRCLYRTHTSYMVVGHCVVQVVCVCVCVCACGPTERRTPCGRCPDEQIPPTPSTPRAGPVGIHSPTRTKSQKVHDTHTLNLSVSVASHSSGMAQLGLRAAVAACVLQLASAAAPICNISAVEEEKRICEG